MRKLGVLLLLLLSISIFGNENHGTPLLRRFYIWPDFCLEHLIDDPDSASSWLHYSSEGPLLEDEYYEGQSDFIDVVSRIDTSLMDQAKDYYQFIPKINNTSCGYIFCTKCNHPVTRQQFVVWGTWPDGWRLNFPMEYHCHCSYYPIRYDKEQQHHEYIVSNWEFCESVPIWSGYFQKYRSPYFAHFIELLQLCKQNSVCRCYWPEESSQMRKILDEIFMDFLSLKHADLSETEIYNTIDLHIDDGIAAIDTLVAQLSHSFLYSQLKEALYQLDPVVSYSLHHPGILDEVTNLDEIDKMAIPFHQEYCDQLLKKIQPMFVEMYETCYQKHPNQKIAKELQVLTEDMQK